MNNHNESINDIKRFYYDNTVWNKRMTDISLRQEIYIDRKGVLKKLNVILDEMENALEIQNIKK